MANVMLLTVWHTGTKYFLKGLQDHYSKDGRAAYSHLNDTWRRKAENADIVYTTYRDPLRVGASWANRGEFYGKGTQSWMELWDHYAELAELKPRILIIGGDKEQYGIQFPDNPINSYKDRRGMHKALDEGNMDYYYRKVPRYGIEHAMKCSEWVRDNKRDRKIEVITNDEELSKAFSGLIKGKKNVFN